ncbi:MAG: hypothetical protein LAN83_12710 [Acidobacteriia bacterium]|nr:hypothetical protein [Terriglobia bacterium]
MAERTWIEQIVEKVVSQVLESHVPQLRDELVARVLQEIPPQGETAAGGSGAVDLLKAISAIHAGNTQREILRALLDNTVRYTGRAALFVMKAGAATGWQGRGLGKNDDAIKDFALDVTTGVAARALESRMAFKGTANEMDPRFVTQFVAPGDDRVLLIPLRLKDKVAALVYADAGVEAGGKMDSEALELLVTSTSAWLEVVSLRKQAQKEGVAEAEKSETIPAAPTVSSYSDPFAAHAPIHTAAPPTPPAESTAAEGEPSEPASPAPAAEGTEAAVAADPVAQMAAEDAEVHRKAQRFARLLVDEIKLYNQAKVAEGRKNKDLYDRLKEDIEKSRATYQKRYGNTAAAGADYFSHELVRSLAEDDSSVMGADFRR